MQGTWNGVGRGWYLSVSCQSVQDKSVLKHLMFLNRKNIKDIKCAFPVWHSTMLDGSSINLQTEQRISFLWVTQELIEHLTSYLIKMQLIPHHIPCN